MLVPYIFLHVTVTRPKNRYLVNDILNIFEAYLTSIDLMFFRLRKITNGMIISLISDEYYLSRLRATYPKTYPKRINEFELIDRIKKQNEMIQLLKNCPINLVD